MQINQQVFLAHSQISGELGVNTFLVRGRDYSVLIDSGVRSMYPLIKTMIEEAGCGDNLRYLINTHAHADHIGSNKQLSESFNLFIIAPAGSEAWIQDFETHYREFCLLYPDIFPDSEPLRNEIFPLMDGETKVGLSITEGTTLNLGGSVRLESYWLPGHVSYEVGFFETNTRTLLLGDAITGYNWSFIHGHVSPNAYTETLGKLERLASELGVSRVISGHFAPTDRDGMLEHIKSVRNYLNEMEQLISDIIREGNRPKTLRHVWQELCRVWNKLPEFRGLTTVHAHLKEGVEKGKFVMREGLFSTK